jgi:hypothetical protein
MHPSSILYSLILLLLHLFDYVRQSCMVTIALRTMSCVMYYRRIAICIVLFVFYMIILKGCQCHTLRKKELREYVKFNKSLFILLSHLLHKHFPSFLPSFLYPPLKRRESFLCLFKKFRNQITLRTFINRIHSHDYFINLCILVYRITNYEWATIYSSYRILVD